MRATLTDRTPSRICVFCGASSSVADEFRAAARALGRAIAAQGHELVYGGASVGLMGVLADSALEHGAVVTGVIPRVLVDREIAHPNLSELVVVDTMHERKAEMARRAHAVIAMPGGFGTLDELFEAATWNQLRLHEPLKPITFLDYDGYWNGLLSFLDQAVDAGFVKARARGMLQRAATPHHALEQLRTYVFS
jgi:uncharacterized protein (TIGR00730 family)